ncbi:aspartate kinase [Falsibacillus pallidus]|uniref:Aspartokinase n=1 Tax=Falsibacillus pallidus TaxID=493781 RepID=A0A370GKK6_9BACI|nr:aspartate kinase [Falsibacillus pallidus]RDI44201.1 aspartate kinase [Falsibacillus pallidus]
MGLIVQKFGGTSVGSAERIQNAAKRVADEIEKGNQVAVVVSAMGKSTDALVSLAQSISSMPNKREMDMLLATGEQVTISLMAMALQEMGIKAVSLTGWQAGIRTEAVPGNARITNIQNEKMMNYLDEDKVVIVAGFQGLDEHDEITTLGRGGSDTTAVALAAALKADRCDIYTDVPGVFTSDPRYVNDARKLHSISYDEMLELANLGAGVLHPRAVEFAKNYGVPLEVRSSMENIEGTIIEEEASMEQNLIVRGVAFEEDIIRVTLTGLSNELHHLSQIFMTLAAEHVNVDIIIQSRTESQQASVSFSIKKDVLQDTIRILEENRVLLGFEDVEYETGLAKVSIVGSGMVSNPGVAARMFKALADNEIQIKMVSTSEIKVSTVISQERMIDAANILHNEFGLSGIEAPVEAK